MARVVARCGAAAAVIDRTVYASGRCFRLIHSRKLVGPHGAPLLFNLARSTLTEAEAGLALASPCVEAYATLLAPAAKPQLGKRSRAIAACADAPAQAAIAPAELGECEWQARWRRVTVMPPLDTPGLRHPRVLERRRGGGLSPEPFAALGRWAAARLDELGCSGVQGWELARSDWPPEALLHLTGRGGRCAHVERAHKSENVMISVDLLNALAWQRCWNRECVVRFAGGRYRKARACVGAVPVELLPLLG